MSNNGMNRKDVVPTTNVLYYTIRSPWAWVFRLIASGNQQRQADNVSESGTSPSQRTLTMVEVSSPRDLPSSRPFARTASQKHLPDTNKTNRNTRLRTRQPCTLRMEIVSKYSPDEEEEVIQSMHHGISRALDGCDDKDELVRTITKCTTAFCPPSVLVEWDISREDFHTLFQSSFPTLSNGGRCADSRVAVLKAPLGSRGEGIHFVSDENGAYEIIEGNRIRASREPKEFLQGVQSAKNRIPAWVLQAEIYPPMLIRNGRKFHIRTYVAILEKNDVIRSVASSRFSKGADCAVDEDLFDTYIYNRHELRIASQPAIFSTNARNKNAHITNGAGSDTTERLLLHDVDEFFQINGGFRNMQERLEHFVASAFADQLVPDMNDRVLNDFTNDQRRTEVSNNGDDGIEMKIEVPFKFAIAGVDVMADTEGKFYLLEVNVNPAAPPESTVQGTFKEHLLELMADLMSLVVCHSVPRGEEHDIFLPNENFVLAKHILWNNERT